MAIVMAGILLSLTDILVLLTFLAWLALFLGTSVPLLRWHYRTSGAVAASHASLSGEIIDTLSNMPVVHSFGGISAEGSLNQASLESLVKVERQMRWISVVNKS